MKPAKTGDPADENGKAIRALGGNGVPDGEIGVVHALLAVLRTVQNVVRDVCTQLSVF